MNFKNFYNSVKALAGAEQVDRVDSLVNPASGLGTAEDASIHAKPSLALRLSSLELEVLYLQSDLARRIIEELVDDTIRQGWEVTDAEDERKIIEEPEELDIKDNLRRAWYSARMRGGGAVAMISKTVSLDKELKPGDEILSLVPLDPDECQPAKWTTDPTSPRYTLPELYNVSPHNATGEGIGASPEFHFTRLLVLKGADLPSRLDRMNNGWGDSILQSCWTPIRNFEQSESAIANIIQRFEIATYSIKGLAEILDEDNGRKTILERMKLIQQTVSMVRAVVLDKDAGEEYTRSFSTVNGLDTLWDRLAHSVAKAARQPMTKLFGMSPSGLATDDQSGRAHWRQQIAASQEKIRPLLEQYYRHFNGGKPVIIKFKPQDEATAKEEADIAKLRAETRKTYVEIGAANPKEFRAKMVSEGLIAEIDMEEGLEGDAEEFEDDTEPVSGQLPDDVPPPAGEDDEGAEPEDLDGE